LTLVEVAFERVGARDSGRVVTDGSAVSDPCTIVCCISRSGVRSGVSKVSPLGPESTTIVSLGLSIVTS
jgi:hypothetical protein